MSRYNNRRQNTKKRFNDRDTRRESAALPQCPLCNKPIRDNRATIIYRVTKTPAHFDCILKDIQGMEKLDANEKLCYLGKGSFGILSFRNTASPVRFIIRKRIQYEDQERSVDY